MLGGLKQKQKLRSNNLNVTFYTESTKVKSWLRSSRAAFFTGWDSNQTLTLDYAIMSTGYFTSLQIDLARSWKVDIMRLKVDFD